MPWALVVDGSAVQIEADDPRERFPSGFTWIEAPNGTAPGDRFGGEAFSRPPPPPGTRIISGEAFLDLFTSTETAALWNADPRLMRGAMRVMAQDSAHMDSPELAGLLALAVAKGVLTPERAGQVAKGEPPPDPPSASTPDPGTTPDAPPDASGDGSSPPVAPDAAAPAAETPASPPESSAAAS